MKTIEMLNREEEGINDQMNAGEMDKEEGRRKIEQISNEIYFLVNKKLEDDWDMPGIDGGNISI